MPGPKPKPKAIKLKRETVKPRTFTDQVKTIKSAERNRRGINNALINAKFEKNPVKFLKDRKINADVLSNYGFDEAHMRVLGYTPRQMIELGHSGVWLRNYGFTVEDFKRDGFSKREINLYGFGSKLDLGYNNNDLIRLRRNGFSAKELIDAGYDPQAMYISKAYSIKELKEAGLPLYDFLYMGVKMEPLLKLGFKKEDIRREFARLTKRWTGRYPPLE